MLRYFINVSLSSAVDYQPFGRYMTVLCEKEEPQLFAGHYLNQSDFFYEVSGVRSSLCFEGFLKESDLVGRFLLSCRGKTGQNAETAVVQYEEGDLSESGTVAAYLRTVVVKIGEIKRFGREISVKGEFLFSGTGRHGMFSPSTGTFVGNGGSV